MAVATFDTLKFANTLKAAGVPPEQAEAQARAFAEVVQLNFKDLATKDDVERVAKELKAEIDRAVGELRGEAAAIRSESKAETAAHRAEASNTAKELKAEIARVEKELKAEIARVERELKAEIARSAERLEHKIAEESQKAIARHDAFVVKHAGDMALMRWMLTAGLAMGTAILLRLFFGRGF